MSRKSRRRKRKFKPESVPPEQVTIPSDAARPVSSVEIIELQVEIEESASPADIREETESPCSLVEIREDAEHRASPVVQSAVTEESAPDSPAPTGADRRNHPRYAFNAGVEVVAAEPGARIKTRVRDLSQQGCYVDTASPLALGTETDVRITKGAQSFEARARVVYIQPGKGMGLMFTVVPSGQLTTLDRWIAESRETSWLAANRRRSQRVLMKLPVRVAGQIGAAESFEEDTHTLAISAHGAMLVVEAPVYRGQHFTLLNIQTKASLECIVVHVDRFPGQPVQVGAEFLLPNPTFWRVAFPPKDWSPRHPDAKSGSS